MKMNYLLIFVSITLTTMKTFAADVNYPPDYDFRKIGFKVNMDSRIAVDGKAICFKFARPNSANRCEAIRNCQPDALKDFDAKLKDPTITGKDRLNVLHRKALILAFKEATLVDAEGAFEDAYQYAKTIKNENRALELLAMKGVVQLRLGELKNCINNHNADSCILPLSKMAQHIDKKGSEAALKTFYSYLEKKPDDDHIKWLVNILHMTLGTYPAGVPKKYYISLKKLESEEAFPAFVNIASELGIKEEMNFGGVAVADFNGDGYADIIFGSLNQCESVRYFEFDPKTKKYVNKTVESGLSTQLGAGLILAADYDNDGDMDIYITRGAWHPGGGDYPTQGGFAYNTLMENDGHGKFTDVTEKRGLRTGPNSTLSANWGDINNDGRLDLFVSNESSDSEVFLNMGDKFVNFTKQSGIVNKAIGKGSILADLNNDGNLDLVIANYAAPNRIFLGRGDGTFYPNPKQPYLPLPDYGFPTAVFDFNNDGYQDIYIGGFAPDIDNFAKWMQGKPNKGETGRMYQNMKDGTFKDVTKQVALERMSLTMSLNFGDLDNDGFKDLFIGTGANSIGDVEPDHVYRNNGSKFLDVTFNSKMGSLQKGHGISFADLNDDGYPEVILQQGGSSHGDRFFPAIFFNPKFPENSFIELQLNGKKANRQGMHSKVTVNVLDKKNKPRTIYSWVGASGSFGTNPPNTIIGLGKISKIVSVVVDWHGSKTHQEFKTLQPNQRYKITEFSAETQIVPYKNIDFSEHVAHAKNPGMMNHHHME